jgi:hypothetical protein
MMPRTEWARGVPVSKSTAMIIAAAAALLGLAARAEEARPAPPEDFARAVGLAVETVEGPPAPKFADKFKPVLVLGDAAPAVAGAVAFGVPVTVMSKTQARDEQRAWFIYLAKAESGPEGLALSYDQPSTGMFGKLVLARGPEGWTVKTHDKAHSSSGARYFYGQLYEGVACRDGTEMAERWNEYAAAMARISAGKNPFAASGPVARTCPGKEFPEVAAYRSMKR